ncbi:MAG TPA: PH domain-containing protein [Candidatus Limnocylindrales bacterium]|jgi:membrane protein YdbS with pleckstrin-like domain
MTRYADSLLTEGEQVVYRSRQHWLSLLIRGRSALGIVILAVIILVALAFIKANGLLETGGVSLVALLVIVGVVILAYRWWQWSNQDYIITNRRLLKVTGILNKHSADSSLEKINDAVLDQPVLGRMLNYGDLSILTAAEEAVDIYHMLKDPKKFKKIMLTQKHNLETGFMYPAAMPPTPPLRAESPAQPVAAAVASAPASSPAAAAVPNPQAPPPPAADMAPPPLPSDPAPAAAEAAAEVGPPPAQASDPSLSVTETLSQLADLRDKGAITPEEYESKKQELLGRL